MRPVFPLFGFVVNKPFGMVHPAQPFLRIARSMQGKEMAADDQSVIFVKSQFAASVGDAIQQNCARPVGCQQVERAPFALNDAVLLRHGGIVDAPVAVRSAADFERRFVHHPMRP